MDQITQALFAASRQGNVPVLKEIFGLRDNLDVRDEKGYTPLIIAVYNGQMEASAALIEAGANLDAADGSGNNALMGACFKGHTEIAALLIEKGASVNARHGNNGTALMFAAMFNRLEIIDLLLIAGADPAMTDNRVMSALDHAIQQGNVDAAEKLRTA